TWDRHKESEMCHHKQMPGGQAYEESLGWKTAGHPLAVRGARGESSHCRIGTAASLALWCATDGERLLDDPRKHSHQRADGFHPDVEIEPRRRPLYCDSDHAGLR